MTGGVDQFRPGHQIAQYELNVDDDLINRHSDTLGHPTSENALPASVFAAQPFTLGPRTVPPRWKGALTASYRLSASGSAARGQRVTVTTTVIGHTSDERRDYLTTLTTVETDHGHVICTAEVVTFWFVDQMAEDQT